ncbi:hypothetical protein [Helicobacter sp. T3_23-1059]
MTNPPPNPLVLREGDKRIKTPQMRGDKRATTPQGNEKMQNPHLQ